MNVLRSCLNCGEPTAGTPCESCRADHERAGPPAPTLTTRPRRGTASPLDWPLRLADVAVVCRSCHALGAAARPGTGAKLVRLVAVSAAHTDRRGGRGTAHGLFIAP